MGKSFVVAVAGIVSAVVATAVQASPVTFNGMGLNQTVDYKLSGVDKSSRAGQILINFQSQNLTAYCVDLNHTVKSSWDATPASPDFINGGRAAAFLYDTYAASVDSSLKAAALQVAIWEVVTDFGGSLNLLAGNFKLLDSENVRNLANLYLGSLPGDVGNYQSSSYIVKSGSDPRSQHLIVPEPATLGVVMVAMIMMAADRRRRRAATGRVVG